MDRNLLWKLVLVIVLVLVAFVEVYPPSKTLNPGLDLAGGTSFIYELDTTGMTSAEQKGLAQRTIDVLRKRIDPTNTRNLIWRAQGNNRIEIQVPLASKETRQLRDKYQAALDAVEAENINLSLIMRSLSKPADGRNADFAKYARGSKERMAILTNLAQVYDERKALQQQRDGLGEQVNAEKKTLQTAGVAVASIEQNAAKWLAMPKDQQQKAIAEFLGDKKQLADAVLKYAQVYSQRADVLNKLNDPENGKNIQYRKAMASLENININLEQLTTVLEMPVKSQQRIETLNKIKQAFTDRSDKLNTLVSTFDQYKGVRGRLDDPEDLRRMLKGAGVLEFRILPKISDGKTNADEMAMYVEALKTKGPRQASDDKYVWLQIENIEEWKGSDEVIGQFANKYYVLASNKPGETLLHTGPNAKNWKLTGARPSMDDMGRRAIGFSLDEAGGNLFYNLTRSNTQRPLAIILDNVAISAPNINSPIRTSGIIEGTFTAIEVEDMVNKFNAGSLPARLIEPPISVKTIGPSIGADNLSAGIRAGVIGLAIIIVFMIVYYGRSGAVADLALVMNLLFTLAIMALSRATFTLPGIAGIILTIGMAVDANVLIHERIREEQDRGASLRIAIKNGYDRAFITIFDSNLTTVLTAIVLYLVASEELKGFAITLILGLAASMFTAVFVTRIIFEILVDRKILKDRLNMMRIIGVPNVDWMKARPIFITFSTIMVAASLFIFFTRGSDKYDIEFTGGTSAQINLKPGITMDRNQVEKQIQEVGQKLNSPGLAAAKVYSVGEGNKQFEINTTATNKTTVKITYTEAQSETTVAADIEKAQESFTGQLSNLRVLKDGANPRVFNVETSQVNKATVRNILTAAIAGKEASMTEPVTDQIVDRALEIAFGDVLATSQSLRPQIISVEPINEQVIEKHPELATFAGGVQISTKLSSSTTASEIENRLKDLRFKPDTQNFQWNPFVIVGTDLNKIEPNTPITNFVYVSALPDAGFRQISQDEQGQFVEGERTKVLAATSLESSLPRMTQIDPSLGNQAKLRGLVAIILSFLAIIAYVWVRFGASRYGFAGVIALVHDVTIAAGAVVVSTYVAGTAFGNALGIGDFKINLDVIAALLTIVGFSINDTIVIFDRIRENRGRTGILTPELINKSINQTMSRTILTTLTAFTVVLIMYIWGGPGLRGFNFTLLVGMIAGTYSTIAIAAPIVLLQKKAQTE